MQISCRSHPGQQLETEQGLGLHFLRPSGNGNYSLMLQVTSLLSTPLLAPLKGTNLSLCFCLYDTGPKYLSI